MATTGMETLESAVSFSDALAAGYILLFDLLEGSMFLLLGFMLSTALFSKTVTRGRTWFFFIASTMIGSLSYLLLLGNQGAPNPPFGVCLVQAAAIYASNPLITWAALALMLELFLNLSAAIRFRSQIDRRWGIAFILVPITIYVIIFVWVVASGLSQRELLEPNPSGMYCHIKSSSNSGFINPYMISAVLTVFAEILIAVFCGLTIRSLLQHRKRTGSFVDDDSFSLPMFVRRSTLVAALSIIGIVMAGTSFAKSSDSPLWSLALPLMPMTVVIIFGSQADLLRVWFPCCTWKVGLRRQRMSLPVSP